MKKDPENVGAALGRLPSGCCILTTAHEGRETGLLVSWVQQAAFHPPSLTVCIKQGRPAAELMDASGRFLLNVVGEDPSAMFKHFGKGFTLDEDAFTGVATKATEFGPWIETCLAQMGCVVRQKVAIGDHDLYVAEVVAAAGGLDRPYIHLRKSGLSY